MKTFVGYYSVKTRKYLYKVIVQGETIEEAYERYKQGFRDFLDMNYVSLKYQATYLSIDCLDESNIEENEELCTNFVKISVMKKKGLALIGSVKFTDMDIDKLKKLTSSENIIPNELYTDIDHDSLFLGLYIELNEDLEIHECNSIVVRTDSKDEALAIMEEKCPADAELVKLSVKKLAIQFGQLDRDYMLDFEDNMKVLLTDEDIYYDLKEYCIINKK